MPFEPFKLNLSSQTLRIDEDKIKLVTELQNCNIIAIDGFPGVGKSTLTKYLSNKLAATIIDFDDHRTQGTGSFLLNENDSNKINQILTQNTKNKIILDGVMVWDFLQKHKIQFDKYVWVAEKDNNNNTYQFIFSPYQGTRVEDQKGPERELLEYFIKNNPIAQADIFYTQQTWPEITL